MNGTHYTRPEGMSGQTGSPRPAGSPGPTGMPATGKLTGAILKKIAVVSMIIDHTAAVLVPYDQMHQLFIILRILGRLAFPLYCFLLVEGFCHTRNVKRYLLSLLTFALISEVPFDLALSKTLVNTGYQNVFFTLAIGVGAMWWMSEFERRQQYTLASLAFLVGGGLAFLLKTDYDVGGILLILCMYILRNSKPLKRWIGTAVMIAVQWGLNTFGLLALPFMISYNGERGKIRYKYLFYAIYPVHLLILCAIRTILAA